MRERPPALVLTDDLPERRLEEGQRLFEQHDSDHSTVVVLVDGCLRVGDLLAIARTADVIASEPTTVRIIGDPETFFGSHPSLALELARQLAGRLHRLTAYLADVRRQFADSDGHLTMVDTVLGRLACRPAVEIDGGSDRSPDY